MAAAPWCLRRAPSLVPMSWTARSLPRCTSVGTQAAAPPQGASGASGPQRRAQGGHYDPWSLSHRTVPGLDAPHPEARVAADTAASFPRPTPCSRLPGPGRRTLSWTIIRSYFHGRPFLTHSPPHSQFALCNQSYGTNWTYFSTFTPRDSNKSEYNYEPVFRMASASTLRGGPHRSASTTVIDSDRLTSWVALIRSIRAPLIPLLSFHPRWPICTLRALLYRHSAPGAPGAINDTSALSSGYFAIFSRQGLKKKPENRDPPCRSSAAT
ncbi:hypothetical protein B0H15DRAFT_89950 [Mycena belliarum]|uniref:Uncharacterized protein n=1 Tax=Mycena belliarum TaxID=1033014 RepID=A0AAD6TNY7_9AGAR|nr:hypothetical protein B0H15DRAFT_89950 [Mycena belliae]